MHLLLALDDGFESLAAVAISSYLSHHRFESVVLVTPTDQRLQQLEAVTAAFDVPLEWQTIPQDAALHRLPRELQPYFFCIEALQQRPAGRYLYVDADTFCVAGLESLEVLPLDDRTPLAACSHGRPMPDRSLVLGLDSPFHYFNAGVLLFDSAALAELVTPAAVVEYAISHAACCRFREQCALNALMRGRVRFLPGQFNLLSWMREREHGNRWHDPVANAMAACLPDAWARLAIVHCSAGALPLRVPRKQHEPVDRYWLMLHEAMSDPDRLPQLPRFADWCR